MNLLNKIISEDQDVKVRDIVNDLIVHSGFDENDEDAATSGLCGMFALALYRDLTRRGISCNLVLVCANDKNGKPKYDKNDGLPYWRHAAVKVGNQYYDVYGVALPEDMIHNFCWDNSGGTLIDVSYQEFIKCMRDKNASAADWRYKVKWRNQLRGTEISESLRLDEGNTIRIGASYLYKLSGKTQLLKLLNKYPALRGWCCSDGEVWVWDAATFTHSFVTRQVSFTEFPIYFWSERAPNIEFEQNGGRDAVMHFSDFMFDLWEFGNKKIRIQVMIEKSPVMKKILSDISLTERSDALLRWFGHSKVVDPSGKPLRVYHGTKADIASFEKSNSGAGSRESPLGYWFTDHPLAAQDFANFARATSNSGANVVPVYLRIQNPWMPESYAQIRDLIDRHTEFERPGYMLQGSNIRMVRDKVDYEAAVLELKHHGYDGIILSKTMTDSPDGKPIDQYIVFDKNQIKSVFNGGNYSDSEHISEASYGDKITEDELLTRFPGCKNDLAHIDDWLNGQKSTLKLKTEPMSKFTERAMYLLSTYSNFPNDAARTRKIIRELRAGAPQFPIFSEDQSFEDEDAFIMEGRHRIVAFHILGYETVPVVYVSTNLE